MAGDDNMWIVGVVLVLLGSIGQNLGNNLMSLGHEQQRQIDAAKAKEEEEAAAKGEVYAATEGGENKRSDSVEGSSKADAEKDKDGVVMAEGEKKEGEEEEEKGTWWFIGTVCFVTGSLSTFVAFGFAAASLLAALESIQFVTNVIFAKTVHNEIVTPRMYASTFAIVAGNVLVVLFSEHSAKILDSAQIIHLYTLTPFHIYLGCFAVAFVVTESAFRVYYNARNKGERLYSHAIIEPTAFCAASALVGAFAVINAKCLSMLIQVASSTDRNEFAMAPFYIILVGWLLFVAFWLRRLDMGFELYPPLFVIPVVQCLFIFFSIVCGGIFFQEFNNFDGGQWAGFTAGVVCILGGVYGLAPTDVDTMGDTPGGDKAKAVVAPIGNDEEAAMDNELDGKSKQVALVKPGSEKDSHGASGPAYDTTGDDKADELDQMVNASSPSSKRKIVKRSIPDNADIAAPE